MQQDFRRHTEGKKILLTFEAPSTVRRREISYSIFQEKGASCGLESRVGA
jgi:hypothetical protein